MTYGINVRPYDDPLIAIAEQAVEALSELLIGGAFLVDVLPILKYVPHWFPGAKFQKQATMMQTWAKKSRNATFAATKKIDGIYSIAISGLFSDSLIITPVQEHGDYDPSLVSEALSQIQHADNPTQEIDVLKDVAAQAYMGESASFICLLSCLLS
jgi:hypothetical protein